MPQSQRLNEMNAKGHILWIYFVDGVIQYTCGVGVVHLMQTLQGGPVPVLHYPQ